MDKLIIHDIRKEIFDLDLSEYQLTFDDGLFSQYYYFSLFKPNHKPRIFFIVTGFIQPGKARNVFNGQYIAHIKSPEYMYEAFVKKNFDCFMRLEELEIITGQKNVIIGAHSHYHDIILTEHRLKKPLSQWKLKRLLCPMQSHDSMPLNRRSKLAFQGYLWSGKNLVERPRKEWVDYIKYDTELCLEWFEKYLGFKPSIYCFPFNEYSHLLVETLKGFGFTHFYNGRSGDDIKIFNRVDIDQLLKI